MNTQVLEKIEKGQMKKVPDIKAGDTVRVHQKIKEGKKERIQVFEGVVLKVKGGGLRKSFIVRKISFGIGVEKNFLIHSPNITKIEIKKRAKVRRANLSYLRNLTGKSARLRDKQFDSLVVNVKDEPEETEEEKKGDTMKKIKEDKKPALTDDSGRDADVTELDESAVGDIETDLPLSEVEKKERKEADDEDEIKEGLDETDDQKQEIEEIESGVEKAEKDMEKGKNKKDDKSEKTPEMKQE